MGTTNIRRATLDDLDVVHQIVQDAYAHYVPRIGLKPAPMVRNYASSVADGSLYVVDLDGRVAGSIRVYTMGDAMSLGDLAVAPHAQGSGLGRLLMDFAEQKAVDEGFARMKLFTNVAMTENIAIYLKRGYKETHRAVQQGHHRVFMAKELRSPGRDQLPDRDHSLP